MASTSGPGVSGTGSPSAYMFPPIATERQKQIERTKIGVLVLLVGSLTSWLPVVGFVGLICTLVGAILVILGRDAFGAEHRRNVVVSIVLFFLGGLIALVGGVLALALGLSAIEGAGNEFELAGALEDVFTNIVFVAAVGAFVSGLASVFFIQSLQRREGRLLLVAAYAATVAVQFATLLVALPILSGVSRIVAHAAFAGGTIDAAGISALVTDAVSRVQWLKVIPALLYATANLLAWNRIHKGEIPEPAGSSAGPRNP